MKKVGILLNSTNCSKPLYDTVSEMAKNDLVELFFLLSKDIKTQQGLLQRIWFVIKTKGILRFIDSAVFMLLTTVERKFISVFSQESKEDNKIYNIETFNKNDIVHLDPIFSNSGLFVHYKEEDIEKIKSLKLDIIIRGNTNAIFRGGILKSSQEGIISFHHGDNRWNRGVPPGFWEVYLRKPSTGFIIQILSEDLDGGTVIFRGNISTRSSYTMNVAKLYSESYPYLAKIILDYAISGKLPAPEEKTPFGELILKIPSFTTSIKYFFMTTALFSLKFLNQYILRRYDRWGVAFCSVSWHDAILRKGLKIKNPPNHFFADPFVITKNGRTILYVEDFSYKQEKGCITAIEIIDNKNYSILGPVIEEPFHMSFPFLFEYQRELFMVPETIKSNSIRLYRCVDFPLKWEYQKDVLSDCDAADSMIFNHEKNWWLLTNIATKGNTDHNSQLCAYYSNDPISGEWIAHDSNPLVFDSLKGRNGGILDIENKFPIRVRQKQGFDSYGSGITLARITDITPSSFSEQEIGQILPHFFPKIKGCHHVHSNDKYTVYDYVRTETLK